MMYAKFSTKDVIEVLTTPRQRLWFARIVLIIAALGIVAYLISSTVVYGAEYATYMRVVDLEYDLNYVKAMDEDGQLWEVVCKDFKTRKGERIRKHDVVMVIMDLQYDSGLGTFLIGNSYIEDKL